MNCTYRLSIVPSVAPVLALSAALALPLPAQDPQARTATSAEPLLVVQTSRPDVAMGLASSLGYDKVPPEAAEGSHWVVTLRTGGAVTLTTAVGDAPLLDLKADPAGLMQHFADEIDGAQAMLRGMLTLGMASVGVEAKQVESFTRELFDFPKQLQRATLRVVGDPESPEQGFDVTLGLVPKAGSAFAKTYETLKPAPAGAPAIPEGADAAMRMRVSLAPEAMRAMLLPLAEMNAAMTQQDPELRRQSASLYRRLLEVFDGGMSVAVGEDAHGWFAAGLRDAAGAKAIWQSEEFLALQQNQQLADRNVEVEVTPNALEHRGVQLTKSVTTNDGPPNPMLPGGTMESYSGIAGEFMVGTFGGAAAAAKSLVDQVVDGALRREALPEDTLLDLAVDVRAMMAFAGTAAPTDDAPERVTMTLGRRGGALQLHVVVK